MIEPYRFAYDYRRSVGPILGRFIAGLRAGRIEGLRLPSGHVHVPPVECDPATGEPIPEDWVEVGPAGVVTTWAPGWALIRLDGADTALLHRVQGEVRTGARVRPRWRAERVGAITDIEHFEPCD